MRELLDIQKPKYQGLYTNPAVIQLYKVSAFQRYLQKHADGEEDDGAMLPSIPEDGFLYCPTTLKARRMLNRPFSEQVRLLDYYAKIAASAIQVYDDPNRYRQLTHSLRGDTRKVARFYHAACQIDALTRNSPYGALQAAALTYLGFYADEDKTNAVEAGAAILGIFGVATAAATGMLIPAAVGGVLPLATSRTLPKGCEDILEYAIDNIPQR